MQTTHWVKTYSEYIEKYLCGDHYPGEHHFVALYLIPRLIRIPSLGLPDFVNPDGTKKQRGDIIYWRANERERRCSLALEVKQTSKKRQLTITRSEYNLWVSDHRAENKGHAGEPHLLVAVCKSGAAILPWEQFRLAYLASAYPRRSPRRIPPTKNGRRVQNARSCPETVLTGAASHFFPFVAGAEDRDRKEAEFVAALERACDLVWRACPVASPCQV